VQLTVSDLKDLMTFYPTLEEAACWFECSPDSIERLIKKESDQTFAEFRHRFSGKTRLMLKRKAIAKALEDDNEKMLIYCLRTMTDMDDRAKSEEAKEPVVLRLAYSEMGL
jgi:hypothetical protein